MRVAWLVGVAAFVAQFAVLVDHSWYLWSHFDLTGDFAQYSQAWQQIATGHLDPYDTIYAWNYPHFGYPFYQGDFELMLWPLSVLYWVWPHAIDLLIVQDAALCGAGIVAYRWALEHLRSHAPTRTVAAVTGVAVLGILLAQPWTYWAASYDWHSEPLAILFTVLAGRSLWQGRRRGWLWVVAVLLCTNVAALYVIGLGLALVVGNRRRWRTGLGLVAAGLLWMAIVGLVHSGKGAVIGDYAYLAGKSTVATGIGGIATILLGIVAHPTIAGHVLRARAANVYRYVAGAGTAGVLSALGLCMALVVLVPNALNSFTAFIAPGQAFQSDMAVIAVGVGTAMVVTWVAARPAGRARLRLTATALALALALGALVQSVAMGVRWIPRSSAAFAKVDYAAAAELSAVARQIPQHDEVIVSQGVSGRFAQRHCIFAYFGSFGNGQTIPLFTRTVYVILVPSQGSESEPPPVTDAAIAAMRRLHAVQVGNRGGVVAFRWTVPRGRRRLTLPR